MPGRELVALVGATATGKSSLAVRVAQSMSRPVEILALDSRQLYRGLDVATGKPTAAERDAVPHHLLDLLPPTATPDAASYRARVEALLPQVWGRGAVPLLVGGSGFYLRALREGFHELPGDEAQLRALRDELGPRSDREIREELRRLDPAKAAALHANDRYRQQRALELCRLAGRPASELEAEFVPRPVHGCRFRFVELDEAVAGLDARIAGRTAAWWEQGWMEEVRGLLDAGLDPGCPGLSILGYRDVVAHLQGKLGREEARDRTVAATRRYARRQRSWWRRLPPHWAGPTGDPRAAQELRSALGAAAGPA